MAKGESKSYNPAEHERRIFSMWEEGSYFHPEPDDRPREKRFSMVIPPPNVTGALHLGHALNNTLQDILVRRKRMAGCNTFWLVGTDHAGIATQATVEKHIKKTEHKSRHDLGETPEAAREELVRRIWRWKEQYGGRIVEQLKLMGCSCDYQRERFTLDEGCARAVRETFFKMFRDGLIYRGKRLVNWDTQLQTAVADDEVYHEQVKGHFYHFKYPVIDPQPGEPTHVHIATTRPETMLGDTAVAVHPEPDAALEAAETQLQVKLREASEKERPAIEAQLADIAERKTTLLPTLLKLRDMARAGRKVLLPLVNREIPLICDEWADPSLGSGCVKITPAHDFNDYEVGKRHGLAMVNMLTPDGRVNENGGAYKGMKVADARKKVVEDLEKLGLVEKIEDRLIDLAHSDRSNTPIEPYLSDQWFVKMGDLTEKEAARIQTPFLKEYIDRARSEPRPSGSGGKTLSSDTIPGKPGTDDSGSADATPNRGVAGPLPYGRGSEKTVPGLAQMAIDAVKRGDFRFHPARYEKTYLDWLSEKRDWCISRQLWWGHRIPVWRHHELLPPPGQTTGTEIPPDINEIQAHFARDGCWINERLGLDGLVWVYEVCLRHDTTDADRAILQQNHLSQDPDVLDTWFSSALWPHSTLGWPEEPNPKSENHDRQPLLDYYYPTDVLSTAREIITLWVARMVITGLYNVGHVPFRDVVIHPVIQDGQGRKMSKSLGNGVDPVDIIEEYGADALRYTLAELATETQDIRLPVRPKKLPDGRTINVSEKFEKGRNFCNKLWQAATGFVIPNLTGYVPRPLDPASLGLVDRWILSRMTACIEQVNGALDRYRFSEAVGAAYRFMWDEYCSWYIEMTKPRLALPSDDGDHPSRESFVQSRNREGAVSNHSTVPDRPTAQQVLVYVLDQLLRTLHPVVPFVTEAIWAELNQAAPTRGLREPRRCEDVLVAAAWPTADASLRDEESETQMAFLHAVIRSVRDIRAVVNDFRGRAGQPSMRSLPTVTVKADAAACNLIEPYRDFIRPLAGCDELHVGASARKPPGAMSRVCGTVEVFAPVGDYVDLSSVKGAEESRLAELRSVLAREEARLSNAGFVERADPAVVEQARQRAAGLSEQIRRIESHLRDFE